MVVNWLAVGAAALSSFMLGGLCYGWAFENAWMKAAGVTTQQVKGADKAVIFGATLVLALIAAATFAIFLGPNVNATQGALYGFIAGLCWVATSLAGASLFEHRPMSLFLINGGYRTLQFTRIGLIFGAWR